MTNVVPLKGPRLDAEGLPCEPCATCGCNTFEKPQELPLEGPGWRCVECGPAIPGFAHATVVPGGKTPAHLQADLPALPGQGRRKPP